MYREKLWRGSRDDRGTLLKGQRVVANSSCAAGNEKFSGIQSGAGPGEEVGVRCVVSAKELSPSCPDQHGIPGLEGDPLSCCCIHEMLRGNLEGARERSEVPIDESGRIEQDPTIDKHVYGVVGNVEVGTDAAPPNAKRVTRGSDRVNPAKEDRVPRKVRPEADMAEPVDVGGAVLSAELHHLSRERLPAAVGEWGGVGVGVYQLHAEAGIDGQGDGRVLIPRVGEIEELSLFDLSG